MLVGKVVSVGNVTVNGEDLVEVFVECCRTDLRDYAGNVAYRMVEIRPMVAPGSASDNTQNAPCPECVGFGVIPPLVNYCKTCGRKLPEHGAC